MTEPTPPTGPNGDFGQAAPVPPVQPPATPVQPPAPPFNTQIPGSPPGAPNPPAGVPIPPQPARTNTLAIVALIGSFFIGLVGIICGHIALRQIKRTGEKGRGLALAGTIIGYVQVAVVVLILIFSFVIAGLAIQEAGNSLDDLSQDLDSEVSDSAAPGDSTTPMTGEYSQEFCELILFANNSDLEVTNADGTFNPDAVEIFKNLAETPSPNQAVYQRFYEVMVDPTTITEEGADTLFTDYMDAAMTDLVACS